MRELGDAVRLSHEPLDLPSVLRILSPQDRRLLPGVVSKSSFLRKQLRFEERPALFVETRKLNIGRLNRSAHITDTTAC